MTTNYYTVRTGVLTRMGPEIIFLNIEHYLYRVRKWVPKYIGVSSSALAHNTYIPVSKLLCEKLKQQLGLFSITCSNLDLKEVVIQDCYCGFGEDGGGGCL